MLGFLQTDDQVRLGKVGFRKLLGESGVAIEGNIQGVQPFTA